MAQTAVEIVEEVDAKKNSIGKDSAWEVIAAADRVLLASGQKILDYIPDRGNREELLKKATGRTGNLRAPTLRRGQTLYIGFNAGLYERIVD